MTKEQLTQLVKDYKETFAGPHGERVLKNLSDECHENTLTYIRGSDRDSALNEGKRFVILHIRKMMSCSLEELDKIYDKIRKAEENG